MAKWRVKLNAMAHVLTEVEVDAADEDSAIELAKAQAEKIDTGEWIVDEAYNAEAVGRAKQI